MLIFYKKKRKKSVKSALMLAKCTGKKGIDITRNSKRIKSRTTVGSDKET